MTQPSITCPKCELESFLPSDIETRYCVRCGYHDTPAGTPEGIPGVSAKFRQPTPVMQLQAEIAALEGIFFTWKMGATPSSKFEAIFERHMANIRVLTPHLARGKWGDPTEGIC